MGASSSGDSLQDGLVGNLGEVGALDVGGNTVQGSSQGILGGSIDHLGSNWGGVRRPGVEDDLVSLTFATANLVLKVVDGVLTVVFRQLLQESVVAVLGGGFLNDNFGLVVVQLVDDELVLLAQLQVVEGLQGFICNGNTNVSLGAINWRLKR